MRKLWGPALIRLPRRWFWWLYALDCDYAMRRRGERCTGYREHRWM